MNSSAGSASSPPAISAPGGADRERARDRVDARVKPGDVGDVDPVARLGEQLVEAELARRDDQVGGRDRRAASDSRSARRWRSSASRLRPRGGPCRSRAGRRASSPRLDQRRAPAGRALAVERRRVEPRRVGAVVGERERRRGDCLARAGPANGERPRWTASAHRTPPMKPAKLAATVGSRTTGQVREAGLRRAEQRGRALRRLAADPLGVERRRASGPCRSRGRSGLIVRPPRRSPER